MPGSRTRGGASMQARTSARSYPHPHGARLLSTRSRACPVHTRVRTKGGSPPTPHPSLPQPDRQPAPGPPRECRKEADLASSHRQVAHHRPAGARPGPHGPACGMPAALRRPPPLAARQRTETGMVWPQNVRRRFRVEKAPRAAVQGKSRSHPSLMSVLTLGHCRSTLVSPSHDAGCAQQPQTETGSKFKLGLRVRPSL